MHDPQEACEIELQSERRGVSVYSSLLPAVCDGSVDENSLDENAGGTVDRASFDIF